MSNIPYSHQYLDSDDLSSVLKTLKTDWLTQGPKVREFEAAICKYTGAKYAVAVSSATAGLHIACLAAGIKKGDQAITSPITFVASANCLVYCGAEPVFADVQSDTINISPKEIKKKITLNTKAIIPIHFAGHPCDMKEIYTIAKKHNLVVIEDAAHALGAKYKGSRIGSCKYSDMTIFSFHPLKHITTGEGGIVVTNNRELYEKLIMFREHGITKKKDKLMAYDGPWYYEQQFLGYNYRITDFQCALGLSQFNKAERFLVRRNQIAQIYNQELSFIRGIELPVQRKMVDHSWHLYPIRIKEYTQRKNIFIKLRSLGIGVQVHYIPVYTQPYYRKNTKYKKVNCPNAEDYYKRAISIPIYPAMKTKDIKYVIKNLKKLLA